MCVPSSTVSATGRDEEKYDTPSYSFYIRLKQPPMFSYALRCHVPSRLLEFLILTLQFPYLFLKFQSQCVIIQRYLQSTPIQPLLLRRRYYRSREADSKP